MPRASDIILDWIHEDGYSLSDAGWIRPQDADQSRLWQTIQRHVMLTGNQSSARCGSS